MAIYVDKNDIGLFNTPAELIIALYTEKSGNLYYSTNHITYKDEECKVGQCSSGKYRSISDLIELIQTYFPEYKEDDFVKTFLEIQELSIKAEGRYKYPYIHYCKDIYRCTLCFNETPYNESELAEQKDNFEESYYEDGSWEEDEEDDDKEYRELEDDYCFESMIQEYGEDEFWEELNKICLQKNN